MIVSAQEATRSQWCAAEACGNEAEPYSRLCWRCAKQPGVKFHEPPTLPKPNPNPKREAENQKRRAQRAANPKPHCAAINAGQHDRNDPRAGQPCRGYALPNSPYCTSHQHRAPA